MPAEARNCRVDLAHVVSPTSVRVGGIIGARLTLRADCDGAARPMSLVFVLDRSSWEGAGEQPAPDTTRLQAMVDSLSAVTSTGVDFASSRVGLVTYDGTPRVSLAPSADAAAVLAELAQVRVGGRERDPAKALDRAYSLLSSAPDPRIVLLYGGNTVLDEDALMRTAERLTRAGIELVVAEVGNPSGVGDLYLRLTEPDRHEVFPATRPALDRAWLWRRVLGLGLQNVDLVYRMPDLVHLDSALPPGNERDSNGVRWNAVVRSDAGTPPPGILHVESMFYLRALAVGAGLAPVGSEAYAEFRFSNGVVHRIPVPTVAIEIVPVRSTETPTITPPAPSATSPPAPPSATPWASTVTATSTPTAPPMVEPAWLPWASRG